MLKWRPVSFAVSAVVLLGLNAGCFERQAEGDVAAEKTREAPSCITVEEADRIADQVLQLVNLERTADKKPPVVMNDKLAGIGGEYACHMIEGGFFGHQDPIRGHGPADRAVTGKYAFYAIGENLAAGQQTPAEVMRVWMDSPAHRDIILDPNWTEVGIAVRVGGEYEIYWVQLFGRPAKGF